MIGYVFHILGMYVCMIGYVFHILGNSKGYIQWLKRLILAINFLNFYFREGTCSKQLIYE
jgi:hypothetical protein